MPATATPSTARALTPTPTRLARSGRRYAIFASAAATSAPCVRRTSASCLSRRRWAWTARLIRAPRPRRTATTLTNGVTLAQCELTGVKPGQFGNIVPNPANQYNGLLGGNPNLQPEKADSYTIGWILTPRLLPNFTWSVDYFNIKIDNVIGTIGGNTILLDCISAGDVLQRYTPRPRRIPVEDRARVRDRISTRTWAS